MRRDTEPAPPIDPYPRLELGSELAVSVREAQRLLKRAGHYEGAVDGHFGGELLGAIEQYQIDHGMDVDGVIDEDLWAELLAG